MLKRGTGGRGGGLSGGNAHRTVGKSWAAESQTRIEHTLSRTRSPMRDLCECVIRRGGDKRECEVAKP